MTRPVRLQLSRAKGFSLQALSIATNGLTAVNCARPGKWGNPFDFRRGEYCWIALSFGCRGDMAGRVEASIRAFREWIDAPYGMRTALMERQAKFCGAGHEIDIGPKVSAGEAPSQQDIREALANRNLACWCKPGPCHCDVLLELANAPASEASP